MIVLASTPNSTSNVILSEAKDPEVVPCAIPRSTSKPVIPSLRGISATSCAPPAGDVSQARHDKPLLGSRSGSIENSLVPHSAGDSLLMRGTTVTLDRITFDPQIMGGCACVRGMRIPVSLVLKLLAGGMTEELILRDYPDLEAEDVRQCIQYGSPSKRN